MSLSALARHGSVTTAAMPQGISANLRPNEQGGLSASLPPARYFATRVLLGKGSLPVGTIRALEATQVDFTSDHVAVRVRVVDPDGTARSSGVLQLRRAGWFESAGLDEADSRPSSICCKMIFGPAIPAATAAAQT